MLEKCSCHVLVYIKKCYVRMSLVLPENPNNRQNQRIVEVELQTMSKIFIGLLIPSIENKKNILCVINCCCKKHISFELLRDYDLQ